MDDEARWEAAAALHERALELRAEGALDEAARLCGEALAELAVVPGAGHPDYGNALDTAALLASERGLPADALAHAREAVRVLAAWVHEPEVLPFYAGALRTLGGALTALGAWAEAELALREALDLAGELYAGEALAEFWGALGVCLRFAGRFDDARAAYEAALAQCESAEGRASLLHNLAGLAHAEGDPARARRLAEEGLGLRASAEGRLFDEASLGVYLAECGDLAGGTALLRSAYARMQAALPPDHPELAYLLHNLSQVLIEAGQASEGVDVGLEALARKRRLFGDQHAEVAATASNLVQPLRELGRDGEARRLLALAARASAELPADHPIRRAVSSQESDGS